MTKDDKPRFLETIAGLAELHGRELSPAALKIWWGAMRHWDFDEFRRGANYLARANAFMPKPADFENLRRSSLNSSSDAWTLVLCHISRTIELSDPIILEAVERVGGFSTIGKTKEADLHWRRREFREIYHELVDQQIAKGTVPFALPGDNARALTHG